MAPDARSLLLVADAFAEDFCLAARNVGRTTLGRAKDLSPLDLVNAENIVFSTGGLNVLLAKLSQEESA